MTDLTFTGAKEHSVQDATLWRLILTNAFLLMGVLFSTALAQTSSLAPFPHFRHVDAGHIAAATPNVQNLVLLTDNDFAPWSFVAADGALQGISVDLARAACAELSATCEFKAMPFAQLLPTLRQGQGDAIISGLKLDAGLAKDFALTRPYFLTLARFAVRNGSPLELPDIRTLAGRRVGFVKGTAHAVFLDTYYGRSALSPFDNPAEMQEALRTGQIDAAFGDALQLAFWINGQASKSCCAFLGKAFVDRNSFSRSLVFIAKRDERNLRQALDDALDVLETKNITAEIFARYLPASVW